MRIPQLVKVAPVLYARGASVHIVSGPGVGKTSILGNEVREAIAKSLHLPTEEFGFIPHNLNSFEAPDIRGYLSIVPGKKGEKSRTEFTLSPLMPPAGSPDKGILFFDEITKAGVDVQKPMSDVLQFGIAGDTQLPAGWMRWTAGNRLSDRSGDGKPLMHNVNRQITIHLETHVDDVRAFLDKQEGFPWLVTAGLAFDPSLVDGHMPDDPGPFGTPRSFHEAGLDIAAYCAAQGMSVTDAVAEDPILLELVAGRIGMAKASKLLAFLKVYSVLPTMKQVLETPDKAAQKIPAGRMDAIHAVASMVVQNATLEAIEPIAVFIEHLPKQFQTPTFLRLMLRKEVGPRMAINPRMAAWVTANQQLVREVLG